MEDFRSLEDFGSLPDYGVLVFVDLDSWPGGMEVCPPPGVPWPGGVEVCPPPGVPWPGGDGLGGVGVAVTL